MIKLVTSPFCNHHRANLDKKCQWLLQLLGESGMRKGLLIQSQILLHNTLLLRKQKLKKKIRAETAGNQNFNLVIEI